MASSKNTLSIEASSTSFVTANSTPRKQMPPGSPGTFLSRFGPRSQSSRTTSFASSASYDILGIFHQETEVFLQASYYVCDRCQVMWCKVILTPLLICLKSECGGQLILQTSGPQLVSYEKNALKEVERLTRGLSTAAIIKFWQERPQYRRLATGFYTGLTPRYGPTTEDASKDVERLKTEPNFFLAKFSVLYKAIAFLEKIIGFLKEGKASIEATKTKDAFYNTERENKEIEGIVPETKEKIADTKDTQQETIGSEATKDKDTLYNAERGIKEIEGIVPERKEKIADTKDMQQVGDRCLVENMIAQVAATKERAENEEAKDAFDNDEREIKEIEGIAPEIKEKIADTKDMQQVGDRCLVENMIAQVAATKERAENDAFDNDVRETKEIEVIIPEKKEKIADNKDMQQETVRDKL